MTAPIKTCDYCSAVGVMPTFMDGETVCYDCLPRLPKTLREAWHEIISLRTKIDHMEKQEPVALVKWQTGGLVVHIIGDVKPGESLYSIPVQPAMSLPDGCWKQAVEEIADEGFGAVFKRLISDRAEMLAAEALKKSVDTKNNT